MVIRGNALTGTSRTIYEAVTDVLADWVVEHPPAVAALAARLEAGIAPRTVLWLGELRHYADADGGAAVLDHLNDLLDDDGRVIAIATIWPGYWDSYTAAAAAGLGAAEPAAVVGRLLARLDVLAEYDLTSHDPAYGGVVDVPDLFTPEEMAAAAEAGDPALAAAAAAAGPDGPVIQHLAGARDLLARYDGPDTDPYGQAIITAAMDASRLGHAGPLPAALLRDAAVGYLADPDRTVGHVGEWDTALAWATDSGWALQPVPPTAAGDGTPGYRVAGYLDQHGRRTRADQPGPASLWDALAAHTRSADDLGRLAQAAQDRGLYRHAATAWTAAAAAGRTDAAARLITHLGVLAEPAETTRAARWAVSRASLDDPWNVARLLEGLRAAGAGDAVQALLARDPVGQVGLRHQWDVVDLLRALRAAGAAEVARALVVRVAGQVSLRNPRYLARLLRALHEAGAAEALDELASRTASQADVEATRDVARLLDGLHAVGATDAIRTLATRAVETIDVEDPYGVAELLNALRAVGADEEIRALLARDPGRHVSLDRTGGVADLLAALHAAGVGDAVRVLAARAAAEVSLEDGEYVARLLRVLRAADAGDAIQVLLARDPAGHASLMFSEDVAQLLEALHAVGAEAAVQALAARLAEQDFYSLWYAPEPTRALHSVGASEMLRVLSAQAVADVPIDNPEAVAGLLEELRGTGSAEAIAGPARPRSGGPGRRRRSVGGRPAAGGVASRRGRRRGPGAGLPGRSWRPVSTSRGSSPGCWRRCARPGCRTRSKCWPPGPLTGPACTIPRGLPGSWTSCAGPEQATRSRPCWPGIPAASWPSTPASRSVPTASGLSPGCWWRCARPGPRRRSGPWLCGRPTRACSASSLRPGPTRPPPTASGVSRTGPHRRPGPGQSQTACPICRTSAPIRPGCGTSFGQLQKETTVGQDVITEDRSAR